MSQSNQPKPKKYFDVKVDALVPTTITYRIFSEDEESALKQIDKANPISVKPQLFRKKLLKAAVYNTGSLLIKLTKVFSS